MEDHYVKKWVINCRRKDFFTRDPESLYKNIRLCSRHFEECMFTSSRKSRIKSDAVPTIFDIPNPPPRIGAKRRLLFRQEAFGMPLNRVCNVNDNYSNYRQIIILQCGQVLHATIIQTWSTSPFEAHLI